MQFYQEMAKQQNKGGNAQKPKKEEQKAPVADPNVETAEAAVVEEQKVEDARLQIKPGTRASMDATGIYLAAAMNYYGKPTPEDDSYTQAMHKMLNVNNLCFIARLTVSNAEELKELGMTSDLILNVPKNEIAEALEMFNGLGINARMLPAKPGDDKQGMLFDEKNMSPEAKKLAKEAVAVEAKPAPAMNPAKWETPEMAKEALIYQLNSLKSGPSSALVGAYSMYRLYRKNQETDTKEKEKWDFLSTENLIKSMFEFLDYKKIQLTNGMGSAIRSVVSKGLTPLTAHTTVKKNFRNLSEEDTVGVTKGLLTVVILQDNPNEDLEKNQLLLNLQNTTREDYFGFITRLLPTDKEVWQRFYGNYKDEMGPDDMESNPTLPFKMFTKMITIANMYLSPEKQIALVDAKVFADELTAFVDSIEKDEKNPRNAAYKAAMESIDAPKDKLEERAKSKEAKEEPKKEEPKKDPEKDKKGDTGKKGKTEKK